MTHKLDELEKDLKNIIEKYELNELCNVESTALSEAITTFLGVIKTANKTPHSDIGEVKL